MYALQHLKISVCDTTIEYGLLLVYCACTHEKKKKKIYIYMYTLADSVLMVKDPGGCGDLTKFIFKWKRKKIVPVIQQCSF